MPIEFRCPDCSKLLRTPDESAGKKAKCPQCATVVDVPESSQSALDEPTIDAPQQPATENPYQVSSAVEQPDTVKENKELTRHQFTFDDMIQGAWALFTAKLGPMLVLGAIAFAVNLIVTVISQIVLFAAQATQDIGIIIAANVLQNLVSVMIQIFVQLGATKYILDLLRRDNAEWSVIFSGGPYYLRGFLFNIIIMAIVFGMFGVCSIPAVAIGVSQGGAGIQANPWPLVVSIVLGVVVAIAITTLITIRFIFAYQFIVDRDESVSEALRQSAHFMDGNKLTAFLGGLCLSLIAVGFTICTCFVGGFLLQIAYIPFTTTSITLCYFIATGEVPAGTTRLPLQEEKPIA